MTFMPSTSAWWRSDIGWVNIDWHPRRTSDRRHRGIDVSTSIELLQSWFHWSTPTSTPSLINTEGLDDGGLWGGAVPAVSHPGLKGPGPRAKSKPSFTGPRVKKVPRAAG